MRPDKRLTRGIALIAVLLGLLQFKNARDPLELYFQLTKEIEAPAMSMDVPAFNAPAPEKTPIVLAVQPYGLVRIWEDGKYLGEIGKEKTTFSVSEGNLTLDARESQTAIVVEVEWKSSTQKINLDREIKTIILK